MEATAFLAWSVEETIVLMVPPTALLVITDDTNTIQFMCASLLVLAEHINTIKFLYKGVGKKYYVHKHKAESKSFAESKLRENKYTER